MTLFPTKKYLFLYRNVSLHDVVMSQFKPNVTQLSPNNIKLFCHFPSKQLNTFTLIVNYRPDFFRLLFSKLGILKHCLRIVIFTVVATKINLNKGNLLILLCIKCYCAVPVRLLPVTVNSWQVWAVVVTTRNTCTISCRLLYRVWSFETERTVRAGTKLIIFVIFRIDYFNICKKSNRMQRLLSVKIRTVRHFLENMSVL